MIDTEMNCDNLGSSKGTCGTRGHALEHHMVKDGKLKCLYCGATCSFKDYPETWPANAVKWYHGQPCELKTPHEAHSTLHHGESIECPGLPSRKPDTLLPV